MGCSFCPSTSSRAPIVCWHDRDEIEAVERSIEIAEKTVKRGWYVVEGAALNAR
jgi:hypothetical protein